MSRSSYGVVSTRYIHAGHTSLAGDGTLTVQCVCIGAYCGTMMLYFIIILDRITVG